MRYLVVTSSVRGHFMEYIHHIATSCNYNKNELFIATSDDIKEKLPLLTWPKNQKLHWVFFVGSHVRTGKPLRDAFILTREVGKICKNLEPDQIIFLELMSVMPFCLFLLPRHIQLSGIIYKIYLYRWKQNNFLRKCEDALKYCLMSKSKTLNKIFILNDRTVPVFLNKLWKTDKFFYLSDPCVTINQTHRSDFRKQNGIDSSQLLFIHFGDISKRKGTNLLFEIISRMTEEQRQHSCFVIAGKVDNGIKMEFYESYEYWKQNANLMVFDYFCPYDFLGDLCRVADYIVLPYMFSSHSSGVIGYAARYNTPVILPDGGMVSKLVKRYHLGKVLKGDFVEAFIDAFPLFSSKNVECSDEYLKEHTVSEFVDVILS